MPLLLIQSIHPLSLHAEQYENGQSAPHVVAMKDHDCIISKSKVLQRSQEPANLMIHELH
jgi:hypothetical protein